MSFLLEKKGEEVSRKDAFIAFSVTVSMGQSSYWLIQVLVLYLAHQIYHQRSILLL